MSRRGGSSPPGAPDNMRKPFRDITGLERTPESLTWLIRKRQSISSSIVRLEKLLANAPSELAKHREDLAAIDKTMKMHRIQVDPATIQPVRRKTKSPFAYGELARNILSFMRKAGAPQTTTQITLHLMQVLRFPMTRATQSRVRRSVISAMNGLRTNGYVTGNLLEDGYQSGHNGEAIWTFTAKPRQRAPQKRDR